MTTTPDLTVREYEPNDREFVSWTLRSTARHAMLRDAFYDDAGFDRQVAEATGRIDALGRDRRWIVLVAAWRGERCGVLVAPPAGSLGESELGVPGLPAARSGARAYVDPWYAEVGAREALDEAADLARQAARVARTRNDGPA